MSLKRLYADIAKVEEQTDGTLRVFGFASSESVDSDGEVITSDAMKAALPDYMKFGAVREMHQPLAAGTALEAEVQSDGRTFLVAHVVDPVAVKKVQTKTYKGFSIGGKVQERDPDDKTKITKLKLVEISLVDRPANPDAVFEMYKVEKDEEPVTAEKNEAATPASAVKDDPVLTAQTATAPTDIEKAAVVELATLLDGKALIASEFLALAKGAIAKKAAARPKGDDLKKGISGMCSFASLLQSIAWLASDTAYEAAYEQDGSTVPAQLRDWLRAGVEIFAAMSAEEIAELVASIKPVEVVTIAAAASTGDLEKKGARYSKATKQTLADMHKVLMECCEKFEALGYKQAEEIEEAEPTGDLTKTEQPTQSPEPTAGDLFKSEMAKRDATIEDLTKRLKAIEAQPLPPKGVLKVVGKSDDLGPGTERTEISPVKKSDGSVDDVATLVKAAQSGPGFRIA